MDNCLFCRIIRGEIPSTKVFEDEKCYAFRDINPQARVHVILVPKTHVSDVCDAADRLDDGTLAHMLRAVKTVARAEGLDNGFRIVSNCGPDACQSVGHWHIHIMGGEQLKDRMG